MKVEKNRGNIREMRNMRETKVEGRGNEVKDEGKYLLKRINEVLGLEKNREQCEGKILRKVRGRIKCEGDVKDEK